MTVVIAYNTPTAAYRRIYFSLVDATDKYTPEDITVTGVKANLSFNGAADAPSTNDIVKVDAAAGEYYIELTQAESATALGNVRGWLTPTGCALTKFNAVIGPLESYESPATELAVADGGITSTTFAAGAITAASTAADFVTEVQSGLATAAAVAALPTAVQNADALLGRSQQGASNDSPTVSEAIASGLMVISISGATMTVKHGDGTTAFTRTITRSAVDAIISSVE